jgi:serine/threonine protein kinase/thioredoxin-like negative regulator of GroEL
MHVRGRGVAHSEIVIGQTLAHYRITGAIGVGGMGAVYRAIDTKLGREVALKVLPPAMAADPDRLQRFRREARAVAALNHPHIVTLYSVEEVDGTHFLTMELVEGQTLDSLLAGGRLSIDRVLEIAAALAGALEAAHERGIVHRDLKPANVIVGESGRVKVLDFGLAKLTAAPSGDTDDTEFLPSSRTQDGIVMGTMPYMSPEQVEGLPVDERTDIFSLGVVLHEMTTGKRPFAGGSAAALFSSILRDHPPQLRTFRPDAPGALERLIERCLEKDRERRLSAKGVQAEIQSLRRGIDSGGTRAEAAPAPPQRSIVVLPFANLSPDADNEYFSDGLTEELIADLSKIHALSVISRTSSMQLKGAKKDVRTIGRELGVAYVLEGSVRKAGNSLRITAQLVDATADTPLWSEKYSGTLDDVFEVQERVSREIVKALDIRLSSEEQRRLAERPIANAKAFELYLQARVELRRMSGNAADRATALVREAVRIEGETPPLTALLAWAKVMEVRAGASRDHTPLDSAERDARQLLTQVPDASYGHALLGQIEYERGHLPEAVHHFKRALMRAPNDSDAMMYMGVSYIGAGQIDRVFEVASRMMASDPLSPQSWMVAGIGHWFVGQPEIGFPSLQRSLELDPQNFIGHWSIGYGYALAGRLSDASRHARILDAAGPDVPYTRQLLALVDALEGRRDAALSRIVSVDDAALDAHHRFHLAESFAMCGELDRALDLLERSVLGFYPYPFLADHCRFLDPLRGTPRFDRVLEIARERVAAFVTRDLELNRALGS